MEIETNKFAIILHIGAGHYSHAKEKYYYNICRFALSSACNYLKQSDMCTAMMACNIALKILEDSEITNAGFGSNLTINGNVECEACMMDGNSLRFAATGLLKRVKNPVEMAYNLLTHQIGKPISAAGRVFPSLLCGDGAESWAKQNVPELKFVSNSMLKSKKAISAWRKYSTMALEDETKSFKSKRLDTIGVVCVSPDGRVASASSSGGIAIKQEGRLGQSCVYGCGCWAENNVGIVSTGTGEQLIRTQLAQKIGTKILESDSILYDVVKESFQREFLSSRYLENEFGPKVAGVVGLKWSPESSIAEGFVAHSSDALCYGYATCCKNGNQISCHISRKSMMNDFTISTFSI